MKLRLKGNKALLKKLGKIDDEARFVIHGEIRQGLENIELDAKLNAPTGVGSFLKNSIQAQIDPNALRGQVEVGMRYAPFLEFGTGTKVSVPAGLESYADDFRGMKFDNAGSFEDSIREWVKRKGIDEEAVWPIMMKILRVGIAPKPFLFPAFNRELPKLLKRINNGLNKKL